MKNKTNSTRSILRRFCIIAMVVAVMFSTVACGCSRSSDPTVPSDPATSPTKPTSPTSPTTPTTPTSPTGPIDDAYNANFSDNTWAEIADACQKNKVPDTWLVGDTKEMEIDGQSYTVAIIGKNHDTYADGGIAPLTFQVIDLVTMAQMNSSATNEGGWTNSALRAMLNGDAFLNKLPNEVRKNLKVVNKMTNNGNADVIGEIAENIVTDGDKLFLLSSVEVTGAKFWDWYQVAYCNYLASLGVSEQQLAAYREIYADFCGTMQAEGTQYDYYAPDGTTVTPPANLEELGNGLNLNYWYNASAATLRAIEGHADAWWLRTPASVYDGAFSAVDHRGNLNDFFLTATAEIGISFAFCF